MFNISQNILFNVQNLLNRDKIPSLAKNVSVPNCPRELGFCVKSTGLDQNSGVQKIDSNDEDTLERQEQCLISCKSVTGATGCEVIWGERHSGCYAHTQEIASGNGVGRHYCWVFSKCNEGKQDNERT